jgi:hypothetical protein
MHGSVAAFIGVHFCHSLENSWAGRRDSIDGCVSTAASTLVLRAICRT